MRCHLSGCGKRFGVWWGGFGWFGVMRGREVEECVVGKKMKLIGTKIWLSVCTKASDELTLFSPQPIYFGLVVTVF